MKVFPWLRLCGAPCTFYTYSIKDVNYTGYSLCGVFFVRDVLYTECTFCGVFMQAVLYAGCFLWGMFFLRGVHNVGISYLKCSLFRMFFMRCIRCAGFLHVWNSSCERCCLCREFVVWGVLDIVFSLCAMLFFISDVECLFCVEFFVWLFFCRVFSMYILFVRPNVFVHHIYLNPELCRTH